MYKAAAALKIYFSSFGLPAYSNDSVPDGVDLPYITYSNRFPEWSAKASLDVRVWARSTSNSMIMQKADQITGDIGLHKQIPLEGGHIDIWPDSQQAQIMVDEDPEIRYAYLVFAINVYLMPGE